MEKADLARELRSAVRTHAWPLFGRIEPEDTAAKAHVEDLVTAADIAVEAHLTRLLNERMPEAMVLGEEAVSRGEVKPADLMDAPLSVILDPVDGTWNFAHGLPMWGSILCVAEAGRPVLGMIHLPVLDLTLGAARGEGLFCYRGEEAAPVPLRMPQGAGVSGQIPLMLYPEERRARLAAAGLSMGRIGSWRCAAQEYVGLATGAVDYVISCSLNAWDHAAGMLIAQESGGAARLLDGREFVAGMTGGNVLSARSEAVWERAAGVLGEAV